MEEDNPLATEMWVHIFKRLESRKELYNLRFVSSRWNAIASSVLGEGTIAPELNWIPTEFSRKEPYSAVPKWIVTVTPTNLITEVYKPSGEKDTEVQAGASDFPTQSIYMVIQHQPRGKRTRPQGLEVQQGPSLLFKKYGESLKYLCIRGVTLTMTELYKLLRRTPKLQALKIFEENEIKNWSIYLLNTPVKISDEEPPMLQKLKNLTLVCSSLGTAEWLLEIVSKTLLTLDLVNGNYFRWDVVNYPKGLPVLKNLKLGISTETILREVNTIPMRMLERLSIQILMGHNAHLNFIKRFKNSLVELTLQYTQSDYEKVADWEPPCFNQLSQLILITTVSKTLCQMENKLLSSSFPNIKTLTLIHSWPMGYEEAREYNTSRGHWNISSSLETILWITDNDAKENVENHRFTRPE